MAGGGGGIWRGRRRALGLLDHLGHGEGPARAGHPGQELVALARRDAGDQFGDRGVGAGAGERGPGIERRLRRLGEAGIFGRVGHGGNMAGSRERGKGEAARGADGGCREEAVVNIRVVTPPLIIIAPAKPGKSTNCLTNKTGTSLNVRLQCGALLCSRIRRGQTAMPHSGTREIRSKTSPTTAQQSSICSR